LLRDAEIASQFDLRYSRSVLATDLKNLIRCKPGCMNSFSPGLPTSVYLVLLVLLSSAAQEMHRVHARRIIAGVPDLMPVGKIPNKELVRHHMSTHQLAAELHQTIAVCVEGTA
jgi:hypothetical protein